ncbi:MAG: hypothetical protein ABIG69_11870 [Bacteroidota bacterium]
MIKKIAVIIIVLVTIIFILLLLNSSTVECGEGYLYSEDDNVCYFKLMVDGSTPTPEDCSETDNFESGVCYYKAGGILNNKSVLWTLGIISFMGLMIVFFYIGRNINNKGLNINLQQRKTLLPDRGFYLQCEWWAKQYNMFMNNNMFDVNNFVKKQYKPYITKDMSEWLLVEVQIDNCRNNEGNGMFVWRIPLSKGDVAILNGATRFEENYMEAFKEDKINHPYFQPKDTLNRTMDSLSQIDPELAKDKVKELVMQKIDTKMLDDSDNSQDDPSAYSPTTYQPYSRRYLSYRRRY